MNEEYTDDQIEEWTAEDLLNSPLLSDRRNRRIEKIKKRTHSTRNSRNSAN
jgi:hypothetical protein